MREYVSALCAFVSIFPVLCPLTLLPHPRLKLPRKTKYGGRLTFLTFQSNMIMLLYHHLRAFAPDAYLAVHAYPLAFAAGVGLTLMYYALDHFVPAATRVENLQGVDGVASSRREGRARRPRLRWTTSGSRRAGRGYLSAITSSTASRSRSRSSTASTAATRARRAWPTSFSSWAATRSYIWFGQSSTGWRPKRGRVDAAGGVVSPYGRSSGVASTPRAAFVSPYGRQVGLRQSRGRLLSRYDVPYGRSSGVASTPRAALSRRTDDKWGRRRGRPRLAITCPTLWPRRRCD